VQTPRGRLLRPPGGRSIRTLLSILIALLIAAGILAGGYALLLRSHRGPAPTTSAPPPELRRLDLPEPTRLAKVQDGVAVGASFATGARGAAELRIALDAAATAGFDVAAVPQAGIAVHAEDTGALRAWLPLRERTGDTPLSIRLPAERVVVTLAPAPLAARNHFWSRTTAALAPGEPASLALAGLPRRTRFKIAFADRAPSAAPALAVSRKGEPAWRLWRGSEPAAPLTAKDGELELLLAPGTYAMSVFADADWKAVEFTVPAPEPVNVVFSR
jgi:hypothetical protein